MKTHLQPATTAAQDKASELSADDLTEARDRLNLALLHVGCEPTKFGRPDSVAHAFDPPYADVWAAWKILNDQLSGMEAKDAHDENTVKVASDQRSETRQQGYNPAKK